MTKQTLGKMLTYAGTLPFWGTSVMALAAPNFLSFNYQIIALGYAVVIVSFIAGIHWGIYLFKNAPINLFVHSNMVALLAWGALLIKPLPAFSLLLFCFLYLLTIDKCLFKAGVIEAWFMRLRLHATAIVSLNLVINILIVF